jgi:hypothetical protein
MWEVFFLNTHSAPQPHLEVRPKQVSGTVCMLRPERWSQLKPGTAENRVAKPGE